MTRHPRAIIKGMKPLADIATQRACLRCKVLFKSEGFGERICPRCKESTIWKSSVSLRSGRS
jgi:predicted RNA-binding Zn-ribbon protein involved in translation (DUF1610 family)